MASPTKRPLGQLQGNDGRVTIVMSDGSTITLDQMGNVVSQDDAPNPLRAAAMGAGNLALAKQGIEQGSAEDARRFDAGYGLDKQRIQNQAADAENNYRVALMNARTNADVQKANAEYQQAQTQLARDRLTFDQQTQQQEFGLKQANLGYNLLGTAASLRGPANYYQASEYARGVSQMPGTSTFLSALQNNTRLPGFGAQGGLPAPETLGSLTAKLGGDPSGGVGAAPSQDATLAQIGNIAAKGAGQLGAGSLEQLTPTELGLFTSGLDKLGVDTNTFLDQYRRSRIGQSIAGSGYRAA